MGSEITGSGATTLGTTGGGLFVLSLEEPWVGLWALDLNMDLELLADI